MTTLFDFSILKPRYDGLFSNNIGRMVLTYQDDEGRSTVVEYDDSLVHYIAEGLCTFETVTAERGSKYFDEIAGANSFQDFTQVLSSAKSIFGDVDQDVNGWAQRLVSDVYSYAETLIESKELDLPEDLETLNFDDLTVSELLTLINDRQDLFFPLTQAFEDEEVYNGFEETLKTAGSEIIDLALKGSAVAASRRAAIFNSVITILIACTSGAVAAAPLVKALSASLSIQAAVVLPHLMREELSERSKNKKQK